MSIPASPRLQYVCFEQELGRAAPILHCPFCGKPAIELDAENSATVMGCEHLACIYVGAANDFEYQSSDFERRRALAQCEESPFDDFRRHLSKMGYGTRFIAFEITHGGLACGPVWNTDVYGFNMDGGETDS